METSKESTFGLSREDRKEFRQRFDKKSLLKGFMLILFTNLSIMATGLATAYAVNSDTSYYKAILISIGIIFISRQLRALENIVHFGSHYNIAKGIKNDIIINILAAWPVLQDVRNYRKSHMKHHRQYGSSTDPCRARYDRLKHLLFSEAWPEKILGVFTYYTSFYKEFGSDRSTLLFFLTTHSLGFWILSLYLEIGTVTSYYMILAISFFLILPFIRMVAELGEHDYDINGDILESTYNNLSILDKLIFHPAGDAYHVLHHIHPTIPWWNQKKAHKYLEKLDHSYSSALRRGGVFPKVES